MIGFDPDSYRVPEDAGTVLLNVRLISGVLQTEVSIKFFTNQYSAFGELLRELS